MSYILTSTDITPKRFSDLLYHLGVAHKELGEKIGISAGGVSARINNNPNRTISIEDIYALKLICKEKFGTLDAFDDAIYKIQLEEIAAKIHLKYGMQSKLQLIRKRIEAEKQIKEMNDYIFQLENIIETSHENKKVAGKYKKKVFELPELLEEINEEELKENIDALNDEISGFDGIKDILAANSLSDLKNTWLQMPEQKIEEIILASIHQDPDKIKSILNEVLNKDSQTMELF